MRVINYGPGYEPKKIICSSCQSELEYGQKDIQYYDSKIKGENDDYKQRFLEYVTCPVCETWIELSMELIDTPKSPPPPPSAPPLRVIYERFRNKPK